MPDDALPFLQLQPDSAARLDVQVLLQAAFGHVRAGDWDTAARLALQILRSDEACGEAWHIVAVNREKAGDLAHALTCYESALRFLPDSPHLCNDVGRLALRMGMETVAESFFRRVLAVQAANTEAINNLATVLRDTGRLDEAVAVLRPALETSPGQARLWNVLGTVLDAQGDAQTAAIFYAEALKLDPNLAHARNNYGHSLLASGNASNALVHLKRALPDLVGPDNIRTCAMGIAHCHLALGDLDAGWQAYAARHLAGTMDSLDWQVACPRWQGEDLSGRLILVSAEQGLGDEVMFAGLLPDLIAEARDGQVTVAVEPRLVALFQRSFPACRVIAHRTVTNGSIRQRSFVGEDAYDLWLPMGDLLGRYRAKLSDFPARPFLTPNAGRTDNWRKTLDSHTAKPRIGVLWKSLVQHSHRDRFYADFAQWRDVLTLNGIQFVNLQYGDVTEDLTGLDLWTPDIDLKNDLDDVAALCGALDGVIGPANATSNIAAAIGTPTWILSPQNAWTCLGTDHLPWYPNAQAVFAAPGQWQDGLAALRNILSARFSAPYTGSN